MAQTQGKKFILFRTEKDSLSRLFLYLILFCAISYVIFRAVNHVAYIGYNQNDDVNLQNLLNGSMGPSSGFCVYINIILGAFIAFLYNIMPAINWYGVVMLAILIFAASYTSAVIAHKIGGKIGFAAGFSIIPVIFLVILLQFTYTLIAYTVLGASLVSLAVSFYEQNKKIKKFLIIMAAVLCLLAVLLRAEVLYSALAFFAFYVLAMFIHHKKKALKQIVAVVLIIGISFAAVGINLAAYLSDPEWNYYWHFNEARTKETDARVTPYDQNPELYERNGWTETDFTLFSSWNILDDPKFSTEKLLKLSEEDPIEQIQIDILLIIWRIYDFLMQNKILLAAFALSFVLALITNKNKLLIILIFFVPFLMQAYFIASGRDLFRVVFPHYAIAFAVFLCLIDTGRIQTFFTKRLGAKKTSLFAWIVFALLAVSFVKPALNTYQASRVIKETRENPITAQHFHEQMMLFDFFSSLPDSYFVYTMEPKFYDYNTNLGIFVTKPQNSALNYYALGGWSVRSVPYNDFKRRAGLSILPRDLIDNENVYLAASQDQRLVDYTNYFHETYGVPVRYKACAFIYDFVILQVESATLDQMGVIYQ